MIFYYYFKWIVLFTFLLACENQHKKFFEKEDLKKIHYFFLNIQI